jgi:hypothetical protein
MTGQAIYSRLTGTVGVSSLVSTRVYPHSAPPQQKTYPLVVYVCDGPEHVKGNDAAYSEQVRIAGIANSYSGSLSLAAAIRTALHGQSGTWGGVAVHRALHNGGDEDVKRVEGTELWVVEQSFAVWINS